MSQTVVNELREESSSSLTEAGQVASKQHQPQITDSRLRRFRVSVRGAIPIVVVLLSLGGLGYWGHHTGWKIPKFSELTGNGTVSEQDWCAEHSVPESICVACNAELMSKGMLYGWCKEHGVAECALHHAEIGQLKETPTVSQADFDRARRAIELKPRPENDPTCKLHLRRIQFASAQAADKAGIDIALVDRAPIVEVVSTNGEVMYDPTRVARLSSRAAGTVWRVERSVGDQVREGEVLALVDAAQVGQAKAELLQAVAKLDLATKTYKRLADSSPGTVVSAGRVQEAEAARAEAEAAVRKAIQTLVNLGLPIAFDDIRGKATNELTEHIQFLGLTTSIAAESNPGPTSANLIPVTAPRDGVVVRRDVVTGEVIESSKVLFIVADTSRMWLMLTVPLEQVQYVELGQKVIFRPNGDAHDYTGAVTWISTDVDSQTRTVKVRAELPNERGRLRNEAFGAGRIVLREEPDAIVVPNDAVHWEGCCFVAFVRDRDYLKEGSYKVFHTRMVRPGVTNGNLTEVIAGLLPGEVIATKGSGVLRAELLKGNLGAG